MRTDRVDVWHFDRESGTGERVRDLDVATARRLVEHEIAAGREANVLPSATPRRTYR